MTVALRTALHAVCGWRFVSVRHVRCWPMLASRSSPPCPRHRPHHLSHLSHPCSLHSGHHCSKPLHFGRAAGCKSTRRPHFSQRTKLQQCQGPTSAKQLVAQSIMLLCIHTLEEYGQQTVALLSGDDDCLIRYHEAGMLGCWPDDDLL